MANQSLAFEGLVADMQTSVRLSRLAEGSVNPGRVLTQGTEDNQAQQGGTGPILGISVADRSLYPGQDGIYADGNTALYVSTPAVVWCIAQVAVVAGDDVAYDTASGEVNLLGTAITNAIFVSSANIGELVKVRLK